MIIWPVVGFSIGAVLLILGSVFGWKVFPDIVDERIEEKVAIIEGTDQYERWEETPQALDFKVYIFNVTNPDEILAGATPIVQELGPYWYKQYRKKFNITFNEGKTRVAYRLDQHYEFDARASAPLTEDDPLIMLSMHMNSVLQIAPDLLPDLIGLLNGLLDAVFGPGSNTSPFIRTTPKQYLFEGVPFCTGTGLGPTLVCPIVAERGTKTVRVEPDGHLRFSFFNHKNVSDDGEYIINTGIDDIRRNQIIEQWERKLAIDTWKPNFEKEMFPSPCNHINGTDAAGYPPFRKKNRPMYIYSTDICRSVKVHYHDTMKHEGIPGYRYITRDDFLNQLDEPYGQECFCLNEAKAPGLVKENGCLYRGAMDLSNCQKAPVVLTAPHMWGADEIYTSRIIGQTPDVDRHRIFIDIEPNTGSPLRGGKRVQFNMFIRPIHPSITMMNNISPALLPVVWVDEGIILSDDNVETIKDELINVLKILDAVHWTLFSVGIAVMLGCSIWFYFRFRQLKRLASV